MSTPSEPLPPPTPPRPPLTRKGELYASLFEPTPDLDDFELDWAEA